MSVSVQLVHWKCVLASVQIHFSAPKEIFIVIRLAEIVSSLYTTVSKPWDLCFWLSIREEWQRLKKCMPLAAYFKIKQPWFSETSFKV